MTQHIKIDAENILHGTCDARKTAETVVKQHINAIWQNLETWPVERLEALTADLKKHPP